MTWRRDDAAVRAGGEAVVRVAVATLWARPEEIRPVDAPALATRTDIPAWIGAMTSDQQVREVVLTQLLLGERVLVRQVRDDGWAQVIAVEQPAAKLDPRGYPGWLPVEQLTAPTEFPGPAAAPDAMVVDATSTRLHNAPSGEVVLPHVILGTRLTPAGPAREGWRPVRVCGYDQPLWVVDGHLAPVPTRAPTAEEVLEIAGRLRNVSYIWGGVSAYGVDCSGLVHLAWRRLGVRLPRDADDQAEATTPLPLGDERPGDLYFFARPGRQIHHIGIVTAAPAPGNHRRMLHACYRNRRVLEEPLPAERSATLVGAHRV